MYPWTADGNLAAQELLFAPTWAVLKNVPPQLYSLDGISVVASGIGDPLHTEKSRLEPYHFGDTKVKVENDLSKSPPEVVEVRGTQGNSVRINVEYPSLPPKCLNCGKFGHLMNRCHKPPMKRSHSQKPEKVISVVKSGEDVSLAPQGALVGVEVQNEESKDKKLRARSRSRRRSQSRARTKARALSSPPEVSPAEVSGEQVVETLGMVEKESLFFEEKELSSGEGSGASEKPLGEDLLQLEEGEIREVSGVGDSKSLAIKVVDLDLRFDEDKSL